MHPISFWRASHLQCPDPRVSQALLKPALSDPKNGVSGGLGNKVSGVCQLFLRLPSLLVNVLLWNLKSKLMPTHLLPNFIPKNWRCWSNHPLRKEAVFLDTLFSGLSAEEVKKLCATQFNNIFFLDWLWRLTSARLCETSANLCYHHNLPSWLR